MSSHPKNSVKSNLKNIFRWLNALLIIATLLSYLSPFINPAKNSAFAFFGLAYPMLLLANGLFVIFWLWRRNRYFLFSTGCILAGAGYLPGLIGLNLSGGPAGAGHAISVMSYNVANLRRFYDFKGNGDKVKLEWLKKELKSNLDPDILCIQEGAFNHAQQTLKQTLNYEHFFKEKGTIIFSKYPFTDSGFIPFEKTSNSCIWGDLKLPGGIVRVYSIHLQSNWLAPAAMKVVEDSDPSKSETWKDIAHVMRLYKTAAARRAIQAERVAEHIAQSPYPVILCGDFNDTPLSYAYHVLSENLLDSFCEKGRGFGFTYAGKIPGLRIDYILPGKQFKVLSHKVPKLELSDHYPVLVWLERGSK